MTNFFTLYFNSLYLGGSISPEFAANYLFKINHQITRGGKYEKTNIKFSNVLAVWYSVLLLSLVFVRHKLVLRITN